MNIKLGTRIDMKESGFGLLMGKFRQCLTELSARGTIMAGYYSLTFFVVVFFVFWGFFFFFCFFFFFRKYEKIARFHQEN